MKNECELFQMTPMELMEAKLYTLQKIRANEHDLLTLKHEYLNKKNQLILDTDFKSEGCTNEKQRTAYVDKELHHLNYKMDWGKHVLDKLNDDLTIITDLLIIKGE